MTEPDIIILERKLSDAKQATAGAKYWTTEISVTTGAIFERNGILHLDP
jgi:hypothetical protein